MGCPAVATGAATALPSAGEIGSVFGNGGGSIWALGCEGCVDVDEMDSGCGLTDCGGGDISESLISPSSRAPASTSIGSGTGTDDVTGCRAGEEAMEDTPPDGSSEP